MNSSNHDKADDSSTVFDADTVTPDEVPSLPAMPPLTATATFTDYLHNNINESTSSTSIQEESPQSFTSEFLRRFNSTRHRPATITTTATTTVTATRSQVISTNQSSSSSSSKKRSITTNRSSLSSRKKTRQSSRLIRQPQKPDQSCVDKSCEEVEDENGLEDDEPDEAVINQSSSSSQTSTTKLTKYELKWNSKFQKLCDYKRLHGHTNVSTYDEDNKELGLWVSHQRAEYKEFKKNRKAKITHERIQTLESIGFKWVGPKTRFAKNESSWNKRFNELKAYKELHGHTTVPNRWEDYKQLGKWVNKQRAEYKKFKKNEKAYITHERIDLLNSIGFQWECRRGPVPCS